MKKSDLIQEATNAHNGLQVRAQQQQLPQEVQAKNESVARSGNYVTIAAGSNEKIATYQQRKSMLPAYKELFDALFLIPDKSVHERVMRAINGTSHISDIVDASTYICSKCGSKPTLINAATQTTELLSSSNSSRDSPRLANSTDATSYNTNSNSPESRADLSNEVEKLEAEEKAASPTTTVRKKRKRKVCLPQVIKKSHAQHAQHHLQPKLKKLEIKNKPEKIQTPAKTLNDAVIPDILPQLRSRSSTIGSIDRFDFPYMTPKEFLVKIMAQEYIDAETFQEGLLPIFYNITVGDCDALQRQIFVWQNLKKINLNDLFTDYEEDCLQLAIKNNCKTEVLDILLANGLDINCRDAYSNTIIHLAILNEIDLESFRFLVKKLTGFKILLELNDDGYTPLHVAVRGNHYRHAEVLLDTLDMCLLGRVTYNRIQAYSSDSETNFRNYYMRACKQLETNSHRARPKLKMKLLECGDMRSGNTALFYAIENEMDHCIYFLLAHLTDPCIKNHSGQDAKSYFSEFGKILKLDPQIDKAMENVIKI